MTVPGRRGVLAVGLLAAAPLWGCGMKGPPQAPVVLVPAAATDLAVQRLGDEVSIRFVLPTANEDRSEPASLARVDVYAMTTQPRLPPDRTLELEEFMEAATLVASLDVAPPPDPGEAEPDGGGEGGEAPAETASEEVPPAEADAGDEPPRQGDPVLLTEALTAEVAAPVDPWEEERERLLEQEAEAREAEEEGADEPERPVMVPLMTPPLPGPLQREYLVVQVSEEGEESEGGERIVVPLGVRPPEPPPAPEVVYTETTVDVTWEPPTGVRETVQGPVTDETAAAGEDPEVGTAGELDEGGGPVGGAAAGGPAGAAGEAAAPPPADASPGGTPTPDETPASEGAAASGGADTPDETASERAAPDAAADAAGEAGTEEAGAGGDAPADEAEEPAAPAARLESRPIVEWPPASTYEVFEIVEADDGGSPAAPEPLSETPLDEPAYSEERGEYGAERCYAVRTLDVVAGFEVRSRLSPATCVTFVDTFPPAAPDGLTAVGSPGEVSLLWRPNGEEDLAGYLVLRGLPGDETLQPLMDAPMSGNTYRDTTAAPGVRHAYAVRAVDAASNPSEPSDRVEATAR